MPSSPPGAVGVTDRGDELGPGVEVDLIGLGVHSGRSHQDLDGGRVGRLRETWLASAFLTVCQGRVKTDPQTTLGF
jgi:hypothetical protein